LYAPRRGAKSTKREVRSEEQGLKGLRLEGSSALNQMKRPWIPASAGMTACVGRTYVTNYSFRTLDSLKNTGAGDGI